MSQETFEDASKTILQFYNRLYQIQQISIRRKS